MNKELMDALNAVEKEKEISKEDLLDAIENSLMTACEKHFGKADNCKVALNRETGDFKVFMEKTVVEEVENPSTQISLAQAKLINAKFDIGDVVAEEIKSKDFGRKAVQIAKSVILQKICEEERTVLYNQYFNKEKEVVTGVVQRYVGKNLVVNLGKIDAMLNETEMVKGEKYAPNDEIKVYVIEVKSTNKGPKVMVSRTHPELVKRLFENEVAEVKNGVVEIKNVAREAGSRTKIAVYSNNPDVDPVGSCVGVGGIRVNAVVEELNGEKIDVVEWNEESAYFIENALSPAKVVAVVADDETKTAKVVVPDQQLSLAIGKEGQNARLAAKLTGFKIDIKSESQMKDLGEEYLEVYEDVEDDMNEEDE